MLVKVNISQVSTTSSIIITTPSSSTFNLIKLCKIRNYGLYLFCSLISEFNLISVLVYWFILICDEDENYDVVEV